MAPPLCTVASALREEGGSISLGEERSPRGWAEPAATRPLGVEDKAGSRLKYSGGEVTVVKGQGVPKEWGYPPLSAFSIKRPAANSCGTRRIIPTPGSRNFSRRSPTVHTRKLISLPTLFLFLCFVCFVFSFLKQSRHVVQGGHKCMAIFLSLPLEPVCTTTPSLLNF